MTDSPQEILYQAAEIVAAYIRGNSLPSAQLPLLIESVHTAIVGLGAAPSPPVSELRKASPADIRKSITSDAIVSFLDGRPYRTLRRHLGSHGLTPETYRERYGLPADYPMVAQSYSVARSALARNSGLGRRGR